MKNFYYTTLAVIKKNKKRYLFPTATTIFIILCMVNVFVAQGAYRILPLGDSITQGDSAFNSYRRHLWKLLMESGYKVDFVGSQRMNYLGAPCSSDFDWDHEGHWGVTTKNLARALPTMLTEYTPDIVLLHIGTNDIMKGIGDSVTLDGLERIINVLRVDNPSVITCVARIIPEKHTVLIPLFNSKIYSFCNKMSTAASPVIAVNQYDGFDTTTDLRSDGTHPNLAGEIKMAKKWFQTLELVFKKLLPGQPTAKITTPLNMSRFAPASEIPISVTASYDSGKIVKVEFYVQDKLIGEDDTAPYETKWSNASEGCYEIWAKVITDKPNFAGRSAPVRVYITNVEGQGNGLVASFFHGEFQQPAGPQRVDTIINWYWFCQDASGPNTQADFSAIWTGKIQPLFSGKHTFTVFRAMGSGVSLIINENKIIDKLSVRDSLDSEFIGEIDLVAGEKYTIHLSYYQGKDICNSAIVLLWSCPGMAKQLVPKSQLYSEPLASKFDIVNKKNGNLCRQIRLKDTKAHFEMAALNNTLNLKIFLTSGKHIISRRVKGDSSVELPLSARGIYIYQISSESAPSNVQSGKILIK